MKKGKSLTREQYKINLYAPVIIQTSTINKQVDINKTNSN